ncbi:helix-turn-helix domain-containing protein [Paramaledivibacter caminithermalis]|uniref:DNA-binding transcriptional regulator, XRE-family HTH domain n=1 Tax=Paramaledivibacter caminithermalis (strain DSM 15212 / CIP 107654 / DViRD3) TaxID=1121301 RepID=A0A1M6UBY9_PARC5|nr:helix-turn-helix transcriptional regulator [Paramaledivibacter caminithermalis]SHK66687.1 DNA-binding transcriptional regulator, XRE-family HTH domain [Paramaledivibacter caminithermalis DSM 15212]
MNIGLRFKQIRKLHKLSANKLGNNLGVDPSTITKIENGNSLPSLKLLIAFCKYFDITLAEFFKDDDNLTPEIQEFLYTAKKLTPEQLKAFSEVFKTITKG